MTERFHQDLEGLSVSEAERPITSYRRLVKRLGVAEEPEDFQRKIVQDWVDEGHEMTRPLALSLEAAGFRFPTAAGASVRRG